MLSVLLGMPVRLPTNMWIQAVKAHSVEMHLVTLYSLIMAKLGSEVISVILFTHMLKKPYDLCQKLPGQCAHNWSSYWVV